MEKLDVCWYQAWNSAARFGYCLRLTELARAYLLVGMMMMKY
jgi:hypothetical protein